MAEFFTQTGGLSVEYKDILLISYYGLVAGICLSKHASRQQEAVILALAVFSTVMVAFGIYILRIAGMDKLVFIGNAGVERGNITDRLAFFRFFGIANVLIGIIAYTIFSFSWLSTFLTKLNFKVKVIAAVGFLLAVYANTLTLTRTNFAALAVSFAITYCLQLKSAPEMLIRPTLIKIIGTVLGVYGMFVFLTFQDGLDSISSRFAETGKDSRLEVWGEAISLALKFPIGGGIDHLTSHLWAHNLFLDVALTAGWFGVLPVLGLTITIAFSWIRLLKQPHSLANPLLIFMFSCTLMVFIAAMIHPPLPHHICWLILSGSFAGTHLALITRSVNDGRFVSNSREGL